MRHRAVLFPDHVRLRPTSLARAKAEVSLPEVKELLLSVLPGLSSNHRALLSTKPPFVALIIALAVLKKLSLFVAREPDGPYYEIDPLSLVNPPDGFVVDRSVASGRFVARSDRMYPLEASCAHSGIYVRRAEFLRACKIRNVPEATIVRCLAAIAAKAKSDLRHPLTEGEWREAAAHDIFLRRVPFTRIWRHVPASNRRGKGRPPNARAYKGDEMKMREVPHLIGNQTL
jgi:hypothetical protein